MTQTDRRDLAVMLLTFPDLKTSRGPVRDRLEAAGADEAVLATWDEVVVQRSARKMTKGNSRGMAAGQESERSGKVIRTSPDPSLDYIISPAACR